jgi:hypothetical protein
LFLWNYFYKKIVFLNQCWLFVLVTIVKLNIILFSLQASDKVQHLLQLPASSSAKERSDTVLFNPLSSRKRRNSSFLAGAAGSAATVAAAAAATSAATSGETGTHCIHISSAFCGGFFLPLCFT